MDLPPNAFNLTLDFQDADSNAAGFQAAAIVKIDIDKTITRTVGFDLNLPDLGPVELATGANIDFTVGGDIDLDFGFRFGTFTPYLLNSTNVSLFTSIDSGVNASASIGSLKGTLDGKLQLKNAVNQTIPNGNTMFTLANHPTDNLVVVTRSGTVTGATGAAIPIVITTGTNHGLRDGQRVSIEGVAGNTNANGSYFAKVLSATSFSLFTDKQLTQPRVGNANYTAGGTWSVVLTRGTAIGAGVDYIMIPNPTPALPPQITLATGPVTTTVVSYSLASAPANIPAGASTFTLPSTPAQNQVVVTRSGTVTGAASASVIVITTGTAHGLRDGQEVRLTGVQGNTNANGSYYVKVLSANTFSLFTNASLTVGRAGNGAYTSGGLWTVILTRGATLGAGVDYTMNAASPPQITFASPTVSSTRVTTPAVVNFSIDSGLTPSDNNTIGGIPLTQIFSSAIPLVNKFDFVLNGMATASLDANLLGTPINDAITVIVDLNQPGGYRSQV